MEVSASITTGVVNVWEPHILVALLAEFEESYLFLATPIVAIGSSDALKSKPWLKFRKVSAFVIRLVDSSSCTVEVSQTEEQLHTMQNERPWMNFEFFKKPWRMFFLLLLTITIIGSITGLRYFLPRFLEKQQATRDASMDCTNYRDFLSASVAWEEGGDTDQARGVYALAIHHFKKGQCTQVH